MVIDARAANEVGKVIEQTGPTEIQRDRKSIPSAKDSQVEMQDAIVTANGKANIKFEDDSLVQVTEQSKLVIDEFVYDPSHADAGKVGLKLALGTARFASGQIAKSNHENIKIETPTATVAVRGTDFSMTVDEMGRSLIILLPSCPVGFKDVDKDCVTGQIFVTTDAGTVHLDRPFTSTTVVSRMAMPAKVANLAINDGMISNMLILVRPRENKDNGEQNQKNVLDFSALDRDLLKFDDLNINFLDLSTGKLDVNFLQQNYLANLLDLLNAGLLQNALAEPDDPTLPNYKPNKAFGLYYYYEDEKITLYKSAPSHYAQVTVSKYDPATLSLTQDGTTLTQNVNRAGGSTITIRQSQ